MEGRPLRAVVCFVLLPCLPALALALLGARPIPVFRDRIVVIVLAGVLATLLSAVLAVRAGRPRRVAALYGLATPCLSVFGVLTVLALILFVTPSED